MFKGLRVTYWLVIGFFRKHALIIFLSLPLGFLTYVSWLKFSPLLPQPKPYSRLGRVGRFSLTNLPLDIQNRLSLGLTALAPDGTATPSLALSWDQSPDGKTYTFLLNSSFSWHNGDQVQAQHLAYSIPEVIVSYPDASSIKFELKEPYSPFPTVVSQPAFYRPPTLPFRFTGLLRRRYPVGLSDYRLQKAKFQGQYVSQLLIQSDQDTRRYTFYPTEDAAITGFKLGEVDILEDITDPKGLTSWPNITITPQIHFDRHVSLFFNTKDANLADKTLRQALTYAIPLKPTDATRALSPFNPNSWAYNPQVKPYLTNLDTAKELLQKSQQETQSDTLPELELFTSLAYLSLAEAIKSSWESLGIKTTVRVITHPPEQFQALLVAHQIPPDPDQYTLWHSSQATNLTGYNSPKLDKLLEDGRRELDPAQRKQIYQDFQRFLVEDTPAAFLFYQTTYTISRK